MSPALATNLAVRAWPYRFAALALSVVAIGLVGLSMFTGIPWATQFSFTLAGPVVGVAWTVLCVASWFHPANGTLSPQARFVGRFPAWLRNTVRWYASLFLAFFVLFCLVAWPAFSLSNLWRLVQ